MSGPFTFPVAVAVPFDGTEDSQGTPVAPPFVSENTRDGIIEARDQSVSRIRTAISLIHNGTMSNGFWHGYSDLLNSQNTPIVIPWNCTLLEYTFSANRNSMDGIMNFYKNGTGAGQIVHSVQFNNVNTTLVDTPNISFNAGDLLRLRWVDQGQNPRDVASVLFFRLD